jgi:hypothetical protein
MREKIAGELVEVAKDLTASEFVPSPELKRAISRRNVDLKRGELLLVNGKSPTPENAAVLIRRSKERIKEREDRIRRLKKLPDDAGVKEVREAMGFRDSVATDKRQELRREQGMLENAYQYLEDIELAVEEYGRWA